LHRNLEGQVHASRQIGSGQIGDGKSMRWLDGITDTMAMNLSKLQEILRDREAWCVAVHRVSELDKP